jgi:catalase
MSAKASNGGHKTVQLADQKVRRGEGGDSSGCRRTRSGTDDPARSANRRRSKLTQSWFAWSDHTRRFFIFARTFFTSTIERIPERGVHARGSGAHGYFENYESLAQITKTHLFQRPGEKTPAFVRFSTIAGKGFSRSGARCARFCGQTLYQRGQVGPGRK